jgi:hypothetical protein
MVLGLRAQATADLALTLGDSSHFRQPFTLTDPSGTVSGTIYGATGDIGTTIDSNTGLPVTGRSASLSVQIAVIEAEGFATLPEGVPSGITPPWIAVIDGLAYKVKQARPDRTLGLITMILEFYVP